MKCFMVVGMHRSATSLVARGLAVSGVHMGDRLLGAAPSNPHGHWEDVDLIALNDQILDVSGGSWDRPPDTIQTGGLHRQMSSWLDGRKRHELWGCKDPRLALTWPAWLPLLDGIDLHVLTVWRHPDQIAASLHRRNGIPHQRGVELAGIYRQRICALQEALDGRHSRRCHPR